MPARRYRLPLVAGLVVLLALNLLFPVPLVGTIVGALAAGFLADRKVTLRNFFGLAFDLVAVEAVLVGVALALGMGLVSAFSVASTTLASALFTATLGALLGLLLVAVGIVMAIIGNLILGGRK